MVCSETRKYLLQGGQVLKTYHVARGAHPQGHKQREDDERRLEGHDILEYTKEDSAFYCAMHISYPNEADKLSAQQRGESPGGFIMVHGQTRQWAIVN
jgi:murein L,D-transpeptidase YafK